MCPSDATPDARGELEAAWRDLMARRALLTTDRGLAELAIPLIRSLGNRTHHRDALRDLAESWHGDWELSLEIASLLIDQAQRRGMDEPIVSQDTPASWAARALERTLVGLTEPQRRDPEIAGNLLASLGNATRLCGSTRDAASRQAFERALDLDPTRGSWWYDLGLLHKWRGRFEEGLHANRKALLYDAPRRPTLWNLAICATAVGSGEDACNAWVQLGIAARTDSSTKMPVVEGLPPVLVRVLARPAPTDGTSPLSKGVGFELVWVAPLSPCHGVVQSPTFRDAPIDYGDLVLWDGAPVAEHRPAGSEPAPVFALLEILRRGDERRFPFVGFERVPGALARLEDRLPEDVRFFVQHERIAHHCPDCAAGLPHEHEETPMPSLEQPSSRPTPRFFRGKMVLPSHLDLSELKNAWEHEVVSSKDLTVSMPGLYELLGETKRAGQEHQSWRGIERKARRERAAR